MADKDIQVFHPLYSCNTSIWVLSLLLYWFTLRVPAHPHLIFSSITCQSSPEISKTLGFGRSSAIVSGPLSSLNEFEIHSVLRSRATIPRLDSVTYFRPGAAVGKFLSNFQTRKVNSSTLTARNSFGGNLKVCPSRLLKSKINFSTSGYMEIEHL